MKKWINVPNTTFDLNILGSQQAVVGTLLACDETGVTILVASDNSVHSYGLSVVYHAYAGS